MIMVELFFSGIRGFWFFFKVKLYHSTASLLPWFFLTYASKTCSSFAATSKTILGSKSIKQSRWWATLHPQNPEVPAAVSSSTPLPRSAHWSVQLLLFKKANKTKNKTKVYGNTQQSALSLCNRQINLNWTYVLKTVHFTLNKHSLMHSIIPHWWLVKLAGIFIFVFVCHQEHCW